MNTTLILFDKLGIGPFLLDRVAFSIGSFKIYWYAVIIAIGLVLAVAFCMWQAKRFANLTVDNVLDVLIFGLPIAVICARAYYVIFAPNSFESVGEMLDIRNGGLAIYGGIIGAFATGAVYCKIKKVNMLALFDLASFGFMIGQAIGRWGNFVNGEAHGGLTELPWGMTVNGWGPYHPTFLYESLWNILGFILLYLFFRKWMKNHGEVFFLYLAWYGVGRAVIEGLRTDSLYIGATGIRVSQLLAAILVVVGVTFFILSRRNVLKKANDRIRVHKEIKSKEYRPLFSAATEDETLTLGGSSAKELGTSEGGEDEDVSRENKEESEHG